MFHLFHHSTCNSIHFIWGMKSPVIDVLQDSKGNKHVGDPFFDSVKWLYWCHHGRVDVWKIDWGSLPLASFGFRAVPLPKDTVRAAESHRSQVIEVVTYVRTEVIVLHSELGCLELVLESTEKLWGR